MFTAFIWIKTPASWLCDYAAGPVELCGASERRVPAAALAALCGAELLIFMSLRTACDIAGGLILAQIALGDLRYRIIPDQWTALLAFINLWRLC